MSASGTDWRKRAACRSQAPEDGTQDKHIFFPKAGASPRDGKWFCAGCEVRAECLEWAFATSQRFGIWGGLSERERRKIRGDSDREAAAIAAVRTSGHLRVLYVSSRQAG